MGWGARFAGVLLAGAVLSGVAACGGAGPEGQALPAASSAPAAEPDESPTPPAISALPSSAPPPTLPKLAREDSAVGVQAFARHWIELANAASLTGDTAELDELSAASCKSCWTFIERVGEAYANGGHLMGGAISILESSAAEPSSDAVISVTVEVEIAEQESMARSGEVVQRYGAGRNTFLFYLDRRNGSWLVTEIKIEDDS